MTAQSVPWAGSSPGIGTHMEIVHVAELGGGRSQSKDVQAVGARAGEGGEPCAGYCLSSQTGSSSDAGILYPVPCGTSGEFFFKKKWVWSWTHHLLLLPDRACSKQQTIHLKGFWLTASCELLWGFNSSFFSLWGAESWWKTCRITGIETPARGAEMSTLMEESKKLWYQLQNLNTDHWDSWLRCSGDFCHLLCRQWGYRAEEPSWLVTAVLHSQAILSPGTNGESRLCVSERMKTHFDRAGDRGELGDLCALHRPWFNPPCPTFSQPFLKGSCSSLWGADIPVEHERPLKSDMESCCGLLWFSPYLGEVGKAYFYWFLRPFRSRGRWALHRNRLSLKVS